MSDTESKLTGASYAQDFTARSHQNLTFATAAAERTHRKQRLAASFRLFVKHGYGDSAPWMSARDPEFPNIFWMNPWDLPLRYLKTSDLIAIDANTGKLVEGNGILNRPAIADIAEIHQARKDIVSVAHAHTPYGKVWSCFNDLLEPISVDSCIFQGDQTVFSEDHEHSPGVAKALGNKKIVFLRNHGTLTAGRTVEEAMFLLSKLEKSCEVQVLASSVNRAPVLFSELQVEGYKKAIWNEAALWWGGHAMINVMIKEQPDLLD